MVFLFYIRPSVDVLFNPVKLVIEIKIEGGSTETDAGFSLLLQLL